MALGIQPIRYAQERYRNDIRGLLVSKEGSDLDCSMLDHVDGVEVTGSQPANTQRAAAFRMDGVWYRITSDGSLAALPTQDIDIGSVLEEGNAPEDFSSITDIPGFVGKVVRVAVALQADNPAGSMPAMGISIKGRSDVELLTKTETSPLYAMPEGSQILSLEAKISAADGGSIVVEAQVVSADGSTSEWGTLSSFVGAYGIGVRFRATYTATAIGASSALVESVSLSYRAGSGIIVGAGIAEAVSISENWGTGMRQCLMTLKHSRLVSSLIRAYVAFRAEPSNVYGETLGYGTGDLRTFPLAHANGIKYDSVRLYFDGARQYSGYEVNSEVGAVSCSAPDGAVVTVDYEYGWTLEAWLEMASTGTIRREEYDKTEYKLAMAADDTSRSICAVKIELEVLEGTVQGESLGTGTGRVRTYPLTHRAKVGAVTVYADGVALPAGNWVLSDDRRSLRIVAENGAVLTADYGWLSETPELYQYVAVFAE